MTLSILSRQDSATAPLSAVGAKAATLARLAQESFPVPEFFVIPSAALALHLEADALAWPASMDPGIDHEALVQLGERLRAAPVPKAVTGPVLEAYEDLTRISGHRKVAVRSSGAEEDGAAASFAGQFSSILDVDTGDALLDALRECWASYLSARSLGYRAERGMVFNDGPRFAVIVQVQVFSEKAGVLFTEHPLDPGGDIACIEANLGTGDSVVGGLATPDTVIVSRSSGEVVETHIGTKRRMTSVSAQSEGTSLLELQDRESSAKVLSDAEARELLGLGLRIEQLLGGSQDIEWAIEGGRVWLLQARPITSVSPDRG